VSATGARRGFPHGKSEVAPMKRLLPFVLAAGLIAGVAAPAAAQPNNRAIQTALVGVLAQVALDDVNVNILNNNTGLEIIAVDINDSLNNLLQNADIDVDVLNNSLNNVLRNVDVNIDIQDVTVVGDSLVIAVNALGDQLILF
jgi:hypothetical protein